MDIKFCFYEATFGKFKGTHVFTQFTFYNLILGKVQLVDTYLIHKDKSHQQDSQVKQTYAPRTPMPELVLASFNYQITKYSLSHSFSVIIILSSWHLSLSQLTYFLIFLPNPCYAS